MLKKIIFICAAIAVFVSANADAIKNAGKAAQFSDLTESYDWAKEAIYELYNKELIAGTADGIFAPSLAVTKEQLAKMLFGVFSFTETEKNEQTFTDVAPDRWSFKFIEATKDLFPLEYITEHKFNPEMPCSREMIAAATANALGLQHEDAAFLTANFTDAHLISQENSGSLAAAVSAGLLNGSDGMLNPQKSVTRAEAAVILKRASEYKGKESAHKKQTSILGEAEISVEQAISWAKSKDADERFINVAPLYWEYGKITGIRPEVLYAQAAKETNYGKYTGSVRPEQNNWAGIKTVMASGDLPEDHESFLSPEDGVRGHFNHMCAYVGLAPVGNPHERYNKTVTAAWAGTVKYVEELGGKWAPDSGYGISIAENYMQSMSEA